MPTKQLLKQYFGYSEFRPGQAEAIEALQIHSAALAVFPTGGGKSLCYQLPALLFDGITIVVSPLIALMKDQIDYLTSRGIAAARLDSTLSVAESQAITDRMLAGDLKILYVAPERFNNERFLSLLKRLKIALFAVDEAHCISEWGHNFRPDYLKLAEIARGAEVERVLALTATATPKVVDEICAGFRIPREACIVTGFYRHNLEMLLTPVTVQERNHVLLNRLRERPSGPTIVYVTLQKTADEIAAFLANAGGLPCQPYHAGMDDIRRADVQDWWMASDNGIVVATIAFGMGIDKSNVRYVYHYNMPKSLENYSQEIGRAGRDDQKSVVEMLACPADIPVLENFAYGDTPTESSVRNLVEHLLDLGDEFDVSAYELSSLFDLRQLVLRTLLTYLELAGIFQQGTPFYAAYEFKPLIPLNNIFAEFHGEPAQLVRAIFSNARQGRIWYAANPDELAQTLGQERKRIVRALTYMEEHGWTEMRATEARQRYRRLVSNVDVTAICADLTGKFIHREAQEIKRLGQVLDLVTHEGCQINRLVGYFGEERGEPCGHCSYCLTGQAAAFPEPDNAPIDLTVSEENTLRELCSRHPDALYAPRQMARFLCGLGSPALVRAKLTKHALFGRLENCLFSEVLKSCS